MMDAEQLKRAADHPASSASIRDYFAARAMQGAVAALTTGPNTSWDTVQIARWAYMQADAMLAARRLDARGQEG